MSRASTEHRIRRCTLTPVKPNDQLIIRDKFNHSVQEFMRVIFGPTHPPMLKRIGCNKPPLPVRGHRSGVASDSMALRPYLVDMVLRGPVGLAPIVRAFRRRDGHSTARQKPYYALP